MERTLRRDESANERFDKEEFMSRRAAIWTAMAFLLLACTPSSIPQASKNEKGGKAMVNGTGCLRAGTEHGCLVLKDKKNGKQYSLHFKPDNRPKVDTAISFEGSTVGGDTCMQGTPVEVSQWTPLKMRCPKEDSTDKPGKLTRKNEKSPCADWKAWHDRQPGHPATLHVTGECTFNTSGYSVELRPASPQGINPKIYILDRIVHAPTGAVLQVITKVPVHYVEQSKAVYTEATILPDGVTVPVKEVQ